MNIICLKESLLKSINIAIRAIASKTTKPIMECILITASKNKITLTTFDGEIGIETVADGEVVMSGKVAVNGRLFSEMIRKMPDDSINIKSDENYKVFMTCKKSKMNLAGLSGDDFSELPVVDKNQYISISQFNLKEIIKKTIFSTSLNDSNPMMKGEYFEVRGNWLRVVSLDGHRISMCKLELKDKYEDQSVIVPARTLNEISRILDGGIDDEVIVYFTKNHIMFEFDETKVVSQLIEGKYFKVDQMFNNAAKSHVQISRTDMIDALDRSLLLIRENEKQPLVMDFGSDALQLSMVSSFGTMEEEIPLVLEGDALKIGFNPKLMIEGLRAFDDEMLNLYMINAKSPCIIKSIDENYQFLILPINF